MKTNIKLICDSDVENLPIKLQHNARISWVVIHKAIRLMASMKVQKGQSMSMLNPSHLPPFDLKLF